jgi:cytosolic carboxypeptidase protein 5
MLNPDGVSDGHYRMDVYGQNLNRYYHNPDVQKQPAVYAMRKLGEFYQTQGRLCFYMDLHAHPQRKGNFIYDNAMNSTEQQAQTQLFPRLLALNCP